MKQSIQIIGGKYRGKKISFPPTANLRPTANRIKETLFNWLMHDIREAKCLDAFAGSGSLGFEAFSRGATNVTFIEKDSSAFKNLIKLCESFGSPNLMAINSEAASYLKKISASKTEQFSLVFFDPPFSEPFPFNCLDILNKSQLLTKNALVYTEYTEEIMLDPLIWERLKQKQTGQVIYSLYRRISFS